MTPDVPALLAEPQPLAPCSACAVACTPDGWGIGIGRAKCARGRPHTFPTVQDITAALTKEA